MREHRQNMNDPRTAGFAGLVAVGCTYCYATTAVVLGAAAFAGSFLQLSAAQPAPKPAGVVGDLGAWGGEWYAAIAGEGYDYAAARRSNVAFFPVYPCLAAALNKTTGLPVRASLLVVSHAGLLASFVLLAAYAAVRWPSEHDMPQWSLGALGLLPTTFYLRMAYSESTLLCLALLAMYVMARGWRPLVVAAIVGLATAARPVGVALLAPLALYLFSSPRSGRLAAPAPPPSAEGRESMPPSPASA